MANRVFVDENDNVIGYGERDEAFAKGMIHRIVRIFVLNRDGKLLIQLRSPNVDTPNLWDQSASGGVDEGEDYDTAASRELLEEVGIKGVELHKIKKVYTEEVYDSITRKRFNMLYSANYDGPLTLQEEEVSEVKWIDWEDLDNWMARSPQDFTPGFLQCYQAFKVDR